MLSIEAAMQYIHLPSILDALSKMPTLAEQGNRKSKTKKLPVKRKARRISLRSFEVSRISSNNNKDF